MWLYLGMTGVALGAGAAAWWVLHPWRHGQAASVMPWWWRLAWPALMEMAPALARSCPRAWHARLAALAARAGLPVAVRGEHIVGLALMAAIAGAALASLAAALLRDVGVSVGPPLWTPGLIGWAVAGGLLAGALPGLWLRRRGQERRRQVEQGLPFVLDLMTLCVEAGLSAHGAVQMAATQGPAGPLRDLLEEALAAMRAGVSRAAALQAMAARCGSPLVRQWTAALSQADALGISLGPVLRAQAMQCHSERQWRAERLALQAPVKMLLPLIGCIFPCTFIVLAFPIAVRLAQGGW